MKEIYVEGTSLPESYHKALQALNEYGEISDCSDWGCTQKEISVTMVVKEPVAEPRISKLCICSPESLEQYRQEMLDGILDFCIGHGWDYTYHNRMVNYDVDKHGKLNQVEFVINELKRNPESRRAVIDVRDNRVDPFGEDPSCLQHCQFFIRNGKLDEYILFRSNDACKATFMNAFALIELQRCIANALGVEVGTYVHRANSFHAYERDYEDLANYCRHIENDPIEKLTYKYVGGWDKRMEKAKPAIETKIKNLKESKLGDNHG